MLRLIGLRSNEYDLLSKGSAACRVNPTSHKNSSPEKTVTDKRTLFSEMHVGPEAFVMPNPYDAGSARLLQQMGFRALATSSAAAAFGLGRQDACWAVSRQEMLDHTRKIVEATDLPVNADLESGYGDLPEEVIETISQAIAIGCAGGSIEDATGVPDRPLYDIDLATARIRAARDAIDDIGVPFVLTARCEAILVGVPDAVEEGTRRLRAFAAAGADCVFMPGLKRAEDIERVVQSVGAPVNVLAGLGEAPLTVGELRDLGVRRISVGSGLVRRAMSAFMEASREILDAGTFCFLSETRPFADINAAFAPDREG